MVCFRSQRCLHDSCVKGAYFNIYGSKTPAYCKQHAAKGMINICAKRSLIGSCGAVEAARCVPTDGEPTVSVRVKRERESLESLVTTVSTDALCGTTGRLERSTCGINGKRPTHSTSDAAIRGDHVVQSAAVEVACSKKGCRSSSSLGPRMHLNDNINDGGDGGRAAKRARLRLYRRPIPP